MKRADLIPLKIISRELAAQQVKQWKAKGKKVAFTNGVFDILHPGHIFSLSEAAKEGDYLVVGLNADTSVKRLKGDSRPVNNQDARAILMASLLMVDAVVIFEEDPPLELIKAILPDVIVKGGDYTPEQVAGGKEVIAAGGKVVINPILEGYSTTGLIAKMKEN